MTSGDVRRPVNVYEHKDETKSYKLVSLCHRILIKI